MRRRTLIGGSRGAVRRAGTRATHARNPDLRAGEIPMRTFGKTGVKLTVIGLASGRFPLISTEEAVALTRRAVELGINYFDTAHGYWDGTVPRRFMGRSCPRSASTCSSPPRPPSGPARGPRTSSTSR